MKWWVLVLAGCTKLFGLQHLPDPDAAPDAPPPGQWATVSVGARHACALDQSGHLACWGDMVAGGGSVTPARMGDPTKTWTAVAAGARHACAVSSGKVWCWGANDSGQVTAAPGGTVMTPQPVPLPAGTPQMEQVSAGYNHSCAVGGGELWCWGSPPLIGGMASPAQLAPATTWKTVAAGFDHTCAIDASGDVWCWGVDTYGQVTGTPCTSTGSCSVTPPTRLTLPMPALAIAAGTGGTCAVLGTGTTGQLWCWGYPGLVGVGTGNASPPAQAIDGSDWTSVAVGTHAVCGVRAGQATCWGNVNGGALGDGVWRETVLPTAATHTVPADVVSFSHSIEGEENACAVSNGNLYCWGENRGGQLGSTATLHVTPVVVPGTWKRVVAGDAFTCAQNTAGVVSCWGADDVGQISGTACTQPSCDKPMPTAPPVAIAVDDLVGGTDYACVRSGTTITCWGANANGQLGNATVDAHQNTLTISNATGLFGGHTGTCARLANGQSCWGHIVYGATTSPAPLSGITGTLDDVQLGDVGACALQTGQRICWGFDYWGGVGDGQFLGPNSSAEGPFTGPASEGTYKALSLEYRSACAVVSGGIKCWGTNFSFETCPYAAATTQNDQGEVTVTPCPVVDTSKSALTGCTAVATAPAFSCAICNGAPMCWGLGLAGRLGDGTDAFPTRGASSVAVPMGHTWAQLSLGGLHGCALAQDGTLACWGLGVHGQIGDGSHGSNVPVMLPPPP